MNYYQKWRHFFVADAVLLVIMVPWDIIFTNLGVWGFNPLYNLGIHVFLLPLEEWLFFIIVPFACVFIYEVVIYFDNTNSFQKLGMPITLGVLVLCLILLFLGFGQMYTTVTMGLLIPLLLFHQVILKGNYLGRFYIAFAFMLIPFFIVNGILTGSFIAEEVVWYNMTETFGYRLFTIPLEDVFYCLFMMLFIITIYEWRKQKAIG